MRTVFHDRMDRARDVWRTRVDYYLPGQSDYAKGDPSCVDYRNGRMVLRVKPDGPGRYLTGDVGTKGRFEFIYGLAEARLRFPAGMTGAHGCFWLQTTEDYIPGQAEIDVAECFGRPRVFHNVYWRPPELGAGEFSAAREVTEIDPTQWHVYGVDWRPDAYDFLVDGQVVATITEGLSDRPKFLALSMLVRNWEMGLLAGKPLWSFRLQVDWVRVSQES